jgi:prolyl-tRNA editing enzyme YbaK/EbsC (Cys-tRNA(Pro) deacylase)
MYELPSSALRVQAALIAAGSIAEIVEMPDSTRTAEEAAAACGCEVGQIVKSLIFRGGDSGDAYLVLTSGTNRVHEKRLGRQLGEKLERADADFVRAVTGYAIGGVPPLAHSGPTVVVMDEDLADHDVIWAAAGTPRCVFATTPGELLAVTGATSLTVT